MTEFWREIRLPEELCTAAERKYRAQFGDVETLLTFVLREIVRGDAAEIDRREQEIVEQRLKDLGYV